MTKRHHGVVLTHVDAAELYDLRKRLLRTRWPQEPDVPPWSLGTDAAYMRELVARWLDRYDWRAWERMARHA